MQCDESKPGCNQCKGHLRQCPGYQQRNINSAAPTHVGPRNGGTGILLASNPMPQPEDISLCYFVYNYVRVPKVDEVPGFLEFLLPLARLPQSATHFWCAFKACGMASLVNRFGTTQHSYHKKALALYIKALAAVHVALQQTATIGDVSILASIVLLCIFENITAKRAGSTQWASHIDGAMQVLRATGEEQLSTESGQNLLTTIKGQLVRICHSSTTLDSSESSC